MPRKTRLTPELQEKICQAVRAGNYIETACAYVGIHKDTYFDWLRQAEAKPNSIYSAFSAAIEKARAAAETRTVAIIAKAMPDNWQAAAWWLERTRPAQWGKREKLELEHSGSVKNPMIVQIANQVIIDASVRSLMSQLIPKLLTNTEEPETAEPEKQEEAE